MSSFKYPRSIFGALLEVRREIVTNAVLAGHRLICMSTERPQVLSGIRNIHQSVLRTIENVWVSAPFAYSGEGERDDSVDRLDLLTKKPTRGEANRQVLRIMC
jgi:hypothetical protein